jgi:RNA-directed DNA polymerase
LRGIPQGLSISNILSSIYFTEFDNKHRASAKYFRYVDDILMLCPPPDAGNALELMTLSLKSELKLDAHSHTNDGAGKTTIRTLSEGIDYLGFTISKGPLRVRRASYKRMLDAIIRICSRKNDETDSRFMWKLNLRITGCRFMGRSIGWAFYFRQLEDIKQLHRLDVFVSQQLKRVNEAHLVPQVKNFAKTYREIRFNRKHTTYIPNFDEIDLEEMVRTLSLFDTRPIERIREQSEAKIKSNFWNLVKKETALLEKETIDFALS